MAFNFVHCTLPILPVLSVQAKQDYRMLMNALTFSNQHLVQPAFLCSSPLSPDSLLPHAYVWGCAEYGGEKSIWLINLGYPVFMCFPCIKRWKKARISWLRVQTSDLYFKGVKRQISTEQYEELTRSQFQPRSMRFYPPRDVTYNSSPYTHFTFYEMRAHIHISIWMCLQVYNTSCYPVWQ